MARRRGGHARRAGPRARDGRARARGARGGDEDLLERWREAAPARSPLGSRHAGARRGRRAGRGRGGGRSRCGRVWRRGSAPSPRETDEPGASPRRRRWARRRRWRGPATARSSTRENALFNLLASFVATFLTARSDHLPAAPPGARWARFATCGSGRRHIHHFVPGIVLAFGAGRGGHRHAQRGHRAAAGRAVRRGHGPHARRVRAAARARRRVLGREEGILSVQITLAVAALLAALALAVALPAARRAGGARAASRRARTDLISRHGKRTRPPPDQTRATPAQAPPPPAGPRLLPPAPQAPGGAPRLAVAATAAGAPSRRRRRRRPSPATAGRSRPAAGSSRSPSRQGPGVGYPLAGWWSRVGAGRHRRPHHLDPGFDPVLSC